MEGVKASIEQMAESSRQTQCRDRSKWGVVSFQPSADCEAMHLGGKEDQGEGKELPLCIAPQTRLLQTPTPWGSHVCFRD